MSGMAWQRDPACLLYDLPFAACHSQPGAAPLPCWIFTHCVAIQREGGRGLPRAIACFQHAPHSVLTPTPHPLRAPPVPADVLPVLMRSLCMAQQRHMVWAILRAMPLRLLERVMPWVAGEPRLRCPSGGRLCCPSGAWVADRLPHSRVPCLPLASPGWHA